MNLLRAVVIGWLSTTTMPISALEPQELYPKLVRSTAWIRTTQQGIGTGWVVDASRRRLLTNLHVVGSQDRVEAFFAVEPTAAKPELFTQREYYLEHQKRLHDEGRAVWGKVILRREKSDLALVELDKLPDGVAAIPLANEMPEPGEKVLSVGHRHDSESLWVLTQGELRQKGRLTDGYFWHGKRIAENAPCWIVQSPINGGDSGSALVNARGEVVGVLSGVRWQAPCAAIAIRLSEIVALSAEAEHRSAPKEDVPAVPKESIYSKLVRATGWVRPTATDGRAAGWIIDHRRRLLLTTAQGAGAFDLVDVIFPDYEKDAAIAEASAYRDHIGLRQSGRLVRGIVLARDTGKDVALIELESLPKTAEELRFAATEPLPGNAVQTVNHPLGVELLWLHASGTIRQAANIEGFDNARPAAERIRALLLQLPAQAGSAGAAVVDSRGEVVGLLTRKEGAQQQLGYAVAASELQRFVESAKALWQPSKLEEVRERSRRLRTRGQTAQAFSTWADWNRASGSLPADSLEDVLERNRILLARGEPKLALKQLDRLEAGFQRMPPSEYLAQKAEVLLQMDRKEEALKICDTLLAGAKNPAAAHYLRALCRDGDEAMTDVDEAIWNDPKMGKAYFRRGRLHEAMGRDDKAIDDYAVAVELDPYDAEAIRRRAALYLRKREPKRAIADYDRLIELLPVEAESYRLSAAGYLAKGEEENGIAALRSALRWNETILSLVLKDIAGHCETLRQQWPDDPSKARKWLADALKMVRSTIQNAAVRQRLDEISKDADIEKQLTALNGIVEKR